MSKVHPLMDGLKMSISLIFQRQQAQKKSMLSVQKILFSAECELQSYYYTLQTISNDKYVILTASTLLAFLQLILQTLGTGEYLAFLDCN